MMINRRHCLAMLAAAAAGSVAVGPAAAQVAPPAGDLNFDIVRQGDVIGYHRFNFAREGDRLTVQIDVNAQVRRLGISVYRFTHRGTETWRGARLVAMETATYDDGTDHTLRVREENGGLTAQSGRAVVTRHPADTIPTNLWHRGAVERRALLNSMDGTVLAVTVQDLGPRSVTARGQAVTTHGWYINGPPAYVRRQWFDAAGRLVAVQQLGKDGSDVEYRLQ